MEKFTVVMNEKAKIAERIKEIDGIFENMKPSEKRVSALCEEYQILTVENLILNDNMRQAYVNEFLPVIIEEYSKFDGKPLGEKTKDKINTAIKKRINCSTYTHPSYFTTELHLVPLNADGYSDFRFNYGDFELWGTRNPDSNDCANFLDENNKIHADALRSYRLTSCGQYVEDPHKKALEIVEAHKKALEALAEARKAIDAYDALLPSKINSMYINVSNERLPH